MPISKPVQHLGAVIGAGLLVSLLVLNIVDSGDVKGGILMALWLGIIGYGLWSSSRPASR